MASEMLSDFIDIDALRKQKYEAMSILKDLQETIAKLQEQAENMFKPFEFSHNHLTFFKTGSPIAELSNTLTPEIRLEIAKRCMFDSAGCIPVDERTANSIKALENYLLTGEIPMIKKPISENRLKAIEIIEAYEKANGIWEGELSEGVINEMFNMLDEFKGQCDEYEKQKKQYKKNGERMVSLTGFMHNLQRPTKK